MSEPRSELEKTEVNTDKGSEEISLADNTHVTHNSSDNTEKTSRNSFEDVETESLKRSQLGANDADIALSTVTRANFDTEWVLLDEGEKDSVAENVESLQMLEEQTRCHLSESEELSGVDLMMSEKILDAEMMNNCKDSKTSMVKVMDNEGDTKVNTKEKIDLNEDDKDEKEQRNERIGTGGDFFVNNKYDENKQDKNDVPVDKEPISKTETSDMPIDKEYIGETETSNMQTEKDPISEPQTTDAPIDEERSHPETKDVPLDEEHSHPETKDVPSDKEHSHPETKDALIDKEHSHPETEDVTIDKEHSHPETKDVPIDKELIKEPETTDLPINKESISKPETEDAPIDKEHISEPESSDVQIYTEPISKPETENAPIDKEPISEPATTDSPIDKEHICKPETEDAPIDKEPNSEPESSDVPIDTEPISKSESMNMSLVKKSSSKQDRIDKTIDKEPIGKLNTQDQPTEIEHVNTQKTTDVPIVKEAGSNSETTENTDILIDNQETSETSFLKHDNLDIVYSEFYKDVGKIDFHLGVNLPRETKTEGMPVMCVGDELSLEEETATPTPQEDTSKTSFDLPEFSTSSLILMKQSEDGEHGLVSCNIKPQVLGVISESPGEPKEDGALVVLPKTTTKCDAGLSPIREDLETFESNTSKEDAFQKCKDVTDEVKDVAFKGNVQNTGAHLDNLKNEGKYTEAGNAPRDISPSNTEPIEEVSKDSIKDEATQSSNSNTDLTACSQCPTEDRAQEKVKTPILNRSRLILLISLVIVAGAAAALAVPFALMTMGFEEGGIVSGSLAEYLMEFSSSIDFGMFVIEMLTEVGSFNAAFLIFIGLVSGGITAGVLLASGLFRHKDTTKEKLGDGTNKITDITELKEDLTTKDHGQTDKDIVQE